MIDVDFYLLLLCAGSDSSDDNLPRFTPVANPAAPGTGGAVKPELVRNDSSADLFVGGQKVKSSGVGVGVKAKDEDGGDDSGSSGERTSRQPAGHSEDFRVLVLTFR